LEHLTNSRRGYRNTMVVKFRLKGFLAPFALGSKRDWADRLGTVIEELTRLNASTEMEFLSLGESLQEYYLRTRKISEVSSAIAARMSGEEITQAIKGLGEIVDRVEQLGSKSRQGTEIMTSILNRSEDVRNQLVYFARVVKNLHILCNFIKIETARIKGSERDFASLVGDIKNLAADIETKSMHLLDHAQALTFLIGENLSRMRDFEARQQGQSRQILEKTMKNLGAFAKRQELSAITLKDLSVQWNRISQSIGEVVASIQFHDITRQQIEHVGEALSGLTDKLRVFQAEKKTAHIFNMIRSGFGRNNDGHLFHRQEAATDTVAICRLQLAQLDHAGYELSSAVNRILKNLRDIAGQVRKMSGEAKKVTGISDQKEESFLSEMEGSLSELTLSLADYAELNREMEKNMGQVAETVGSMSSFVGDMERIGFDMKKVALNALIHAAHIGEEGRPLSVLAESIHHLSDDTTDQIDRISGHLKTVIAISLPLSESLQIEVEKKWEKGDALADHIGGLINPLKELNKAMAILSIQIDESGKTFQDDIEKSIERVTVHDRVDLGIGDIHNGLESMVNDIRSVFPAIVDFEQSRELLELTERYTMDRERKIHQSLLTIDVAAVTERSPILMAEQAEKQESPIEGEEEALGENVELF
jgi:methyl-accepting chemotaxis protein